MGCLKKFKMPPARERESRFAGLCGIVACFLGLINGAFGAVLHYYGERQGNGLWSGFGLVFMGCLGILVWWTKFRQIMVLYLTLAVMLLFLYVIQVAMASIQLVFWRHFEEASSHCYIHLSYCRCTTYDAKKLPVSLYSCDLIYKFDEIYVAVICFSILGFINTCVASFIGCLSTCFDGTQEEKDDAVTIMCPLQSEAPANFDTNTRNEDEAFVTASSRQDDKHFYWSPQQLPRSLPEQRPDFRYWSPQPHRATTLKDAALNRSRQLLEEDMNGEKKKERFLRVSAAQNQSAISSTQESNETGTENGSFDIPLPTPVQKDNVDPSQVADSEEEHLYSTIQDMQSKEKKDKTSSKLFPNKEEFELELFSAEFNNESRNDHGSSQPVFPGNGSYENCSFQVASPEQQGSDDPSHLPTYEELYQGGSISLPTSKEHEKCDEPAQVNEVEIKFQPPSLKEHKGTDESPQSEGNGDQLDSLEETAFEQQHIKKD